MTNTLNGPGRSHANSLVSAGKIDRNSSWSFSAADGNKLLGDGGDDWSAYSAAHLGVDKSEPDETKGRWSYPFEKNEKIYRSAVIAIKQRASAQDATDIMNAASALLEKIDKDNDDDDKDSSATLDRILKSAEKNMRSRAFNLIGAAPMQGKTWYNFAFDPDNPGET